MFDEAATDMNAVVGSHDVILITLDTLRFDAAAKAFAQGKLPVLGGWPPAAGFECRHTPANFTYAAHQAFLTGFLPTPVRPFARGSAHPRLLALAFAGSESTTGNTFVFSQGANLPEAFAHLGYRTICIGGVGFFNKRNPLGSVIPDMFHESFWEPQFGVADRTSTEAQVALAVRLLQASTQRVFMLLNVSAIHQPNRHYLDDSPEAGPDDLTSHEAALHYVDQAIAPLFDELARRGPAFVILCSDHGTAYGEEGYFGHRLAHPVVMHVPYAHFVIPKA
ncbi:MAG: STM4013/SEN3800 family hydrolase [Xanthomonadales bacterium]|nr:STM4013/SEN3800 family hydrolase [Xanthomonadales bacterium]